MIGAERSRPEKIEISPDMTISPKIMSIMKMMMICPFDAWRLLIWISSN